MWLWIINKQPDLTAPHCCHLGHGDVSSLFHTRLVLLRIKFEFEALRTSPSALHTVRMTEIFAVLEYFFNDNNDHVAVVRVSLAGGGQVCGRRGVCPAPQCKAFLLPLRAT